MFKGKGWFGWTNSKPKNLHSIEQLKYLYNVMSRNQTVTESNKTLLVETLRSISEILIWGDQNDSSVFDFFLEKNMLSFFLKIMAQKCGSYVCVQLLQTLNILFENIRNETSIYYLLSNNHVNSIIVHKFDFSDEEVMAYYISFLKTLSLKLSTHTIHFFFNEATNDFPLYTEAIKFFNHSEKMVRIAVRTITLNVFKVEEKSMLKFVTDRTAAPYFSNLVWFIGNHVLEIDSCFQKPIKDQQMLIKLGDLVAEHLDHLHYLNDILLLRIDDLNRILTDHLLNRLLIPLYIFSLIVPSSNETSSSRPRIAQIVSLFLLSQVLLIISYESLVQNLVEIFLHGRMSIFEKPEFVAPPETLEESLVQAAKLNSSPGSESPRKTQEMQKDMSPSEKENRSGSIHQGQEVLEETVIDMPQKSADLPEIKVNDASMTDEEKAAVVFISKKTPEDDNRPFLNALITSLDCGSQYDDHSAIFTLCLIYAMVYNKGVKESLLYDLIIPNPLSPDTIDNNLKDSKLIDSLISIMHLCCLYNSRIRLITLEMSILLLKRLAILDGKSILPDAQFASIEQAIEEAALVLRNFFKSEEEDLFLDMFEDESLEMQKRRLNVEFLMMNANLLLPPSQLSMLLMNGLELTQRLPCADVERTRYAIRVFLLLRQLSMFLRGIDSFPYLPSNDLNIKLEQSLDLNNSDLISCAVLVKDQPKVRRFMVIDSHHLILIEPDLRKIGWGIVKFVAPLQDVEINADKDDSRSLILNIRQSSGQTASKRPIMTIRFIFDDHIRCMAAKQRLTKGRLKARQRKMVQIAKLIDLHPNIDMTISKRPPTTPNRSFIRNESHGECLRRHSHGSHVSGGHRPLKRGSLVPGSAVSDNSDNANHTEASSKSRDSSRAQSSSFESSEEIQMEDLSPRSSRRMSKSKSRGRSGTKKNVHEVELV